MTKNSRLTRIIRAASEREWTVKLIPSNGGETITVKKVVAFTADLAMREAASNNPGYIGASARATKVLA